MKTEYKEILERLHTFYYLDLDFERLGNTLFPIKLSNICYYLGNKNYRRGFLFQNEFHRGPCINVYNLYFSSMDSYLDYHFDTSHRMNTCLDPDITNFESFFNTYHPHCTSGRLKTICSNLDDMILEFV